LSSGFRRLALAVGLALSVVACVSAPESPATGGIASSEAAAPAPDAEARSDLRALIHLTRCADRLAGIDDGIASCTWLLNNARLEPEARAKVLVARATLLAAIGEFDAGLSDLDGAEVLDARSEGLHMLRAQIRFDTGDYEVALPDTEVAIQQAPGQTRPLVLKAQLMALLRREDEALDAIDRAIALDGGLGEAHVLRAAIVLGKRKFAEAVVDFDRAEELGVDASRIAALRAVALLRLDEYERAITDLDLALTEEPDNQNNWMLRGQAHAELGLAKEAGRDFDRALALAPDSARILNGIAWAYATSPAPVRDAEAARRHAGEAIRIEPQNGYYLDTYAASFVAAGDHAAAMSHYRRAMDIQPEVPGIYQKYLRERGLFDGETDGQPSEALIRAMEQHIRTGCALTDETCEGPDGVRIAG